MKKTLIALFAASLLAGCGGSDDTSPSVDDPIVQTDTVPDSFNFRMAFNVPINESVESETITISGIDAPSPITIENGEYAVNGGSFTSEEGVVENGDNVVVRNQAPSLYLDKNAEGGIANTSTVLTIGGVEGVFASFAFQASDTLDVTPNEFTVGPFEGQVPGASITSDPVVIQGVDTAVKIANTGGSISIDGGEFQEGVVEAQEGQSVVFAFTAQDEFETTEFELISIGDIVQSVDITTLSEDELPNDADELLGALGLTFEDVTPTVVTGALPNDGSNPLPAISSVPSVITSQPNSMERVDVIFDIDSPLAAFYLTVKGAKQYLKYVKPELSETPTDSEAISFTFVVPEDIEDGDFCLTLSAIDDVGLISASEDICVTVDADAPSQGRTILFADFAPNSTLQTLDFDNGAVEVIGQTGFQLTDIAYFDGKLYGVTFRKLIEINVETGEGTQIGSVGFDDINALDSTADKLLGGTQDEEIIEINTDTGSGDLVSYFVDSVYTSGDFAYDSTNDIMYASVVRPGFSTDYLVTIDPATGENEIVGDIGFDEVFGLAFFRDQLLGLTDNGEFIIINTATGAGTLVENTNAFSAGGAATPMP